MSQNTNEGQAILRWAVALTRALILPAFVLACFCGRSVVAQDTRATIKGRVTDPQGSVIRGAEVKVVSADTNVARTTVTNDSGLWQIQLLLPGDYNFTITAPGFHMEQRQGITLQAADVKQFDVQLTVGAETQSVTVIAETPLIDTTAATSGTVVTQTELENLPTQSHVPTLFASLAPGVVQREQGSNVARAWSNDAASQYTADGGRNTTYSNNFQLDGMPNTKNGGDINFIPPMDSVQEFRVQTNAYDASIGRQAGATINMQTRSGGKQYHGVLYEYNQNDILNANSYQNNLGGLPKSPVHFNQFGGTFGGPVRLPKIYNGAGRTFFFVAYDKTINTNPLSSTLSMPTQLERSGDFSKSFTTQVVNGTRVVYPINIYNPYQVDSKGNRQIFNGAVIPSPLLDPIAQKILAFVPLPNAPGDGTSTDSNNFVSPALRRDTYPVFTVRVDQNWNNSQHSFVTVNWDHLIETTDNWFNTIATGNNQVRITKRVGIDHVWTIGDNRVLSMHYTLNRWENPQHNNGAGYDPTKLGFSSKFTSQLAYPSFPYIKNFAGNFGASNAGSNNFDTDHTWAGTLTQIFKTHTFRIGSEYWVLQHAVANLGNQGEFDFGSEWTRQNALTSGGTGNGSTFASYLLGLPNGGNVPVNATAFYSQHYIASYFQDDWRITTKLTLNLGLRWDLEQPVTERFNRLTNRFDPTVTNPISSSAQTAYASILTNSTSNSGVQILLQDLPSSAFKVMGAQLFAGVNGTPRGAINPDYHEWQPRAGFAYMLTPNTVIRGGFGRFTQASFENGGQNGFSRTTALIATQDNYITPYDTLSNPFQSGVLAPTGSSLGPLTNLGQGVNWEDPNINRMYSWEYSLHLQQQFRSWLIEVGYSHNKTYDIPWSWNQNLPSFTLWKQLQQPVFDANGRPGDILPWNTQVPNPFYQLPNVTGTIASSKTVTVNQLLNPIPLLGSMGENRPTGKNGYDAMQSKIERRFTNGLSFIGAFTWSKLFEDTAFLGPQIAGPKIEHKLGGEDRPYVLALTTVWDIPFGRGKRWGSSLRRPVDLVVGGWEMTGNYSANSGVPVVFGTDSFYSGHSAALSTTQRKLNRWFDTSQFVAFPNKNTNISNYPTWTGIQQMPGASYVPSPKDTIKNGVYQDFATYIRNYPTRWGNIRQQGVSELSLGLNKSFVINSTTRLQLRFDAFNALNQPRFGAPDSNPNDSNFGVVPLSQINQARTVELGGKFYF
ncbi:MAG TPA: carboxypeptidase regulatory-like domain-containing protein [Terracidiphilus sp.]|nr:carboxypeptidase regulatory-like domain-containing protein [Terracidiphilus sp.]